MRRRLGFRRPAHGINAGRLAVTFATLLTFCLFFFFILRTNELPQENAIPHAACRISHEPPGSRRPALLFDIDQGLASGIIENNDITTLNRILDTLETFRKKFDVYVIFDPLTEHGANLRSVLAATADRCVPFLLDVYTSDALTVGNIVVNANPRADISHGLPIPLAELEELKADPRIGRGFAGLRFMEVLSQDYTVNTCRSRRSGPDRVDWCDPYFKNLPGDNFFKPVELAKPLLDFAKASGLWVFFSEWKWDRDDETEQLGLKRLLDGGQYANVVVLGYANNLPLEGARNNFANWNEWRAQYSRLVGSEIMGLGLSDQSWTCWDEAACPLRVLADWAQKALNSGAIVLELEPLRYFFEAAVAEEWLPQDVPFMRRYGGLPTNSLLLFAQALGIDLGGQRQAANIPDDQSVCMNMNAPGSVKAGGEFSVDVVMRNTERAPWEPPRRQLSLYQDNNAGAAGWAVQSGLQLQRAVPPEADVEFTVRLRAPEQTGAKDLEFQMAGNANEKFGQRCEAYLTITP